MTQPTAPDLFGGETPLTMAAPEAVVDPLPLIAMTPDQVALFDLTELTVAVPGAAQKEEFHAAGVSPVAQKLIFDSTSIRQIVTYWQADHYLSILLRLQAAMKHFGTDNHTDTLEQLLVHFERTVSQPCQGCDLDVLREIVRRADNGPEGPP